MFGWCFSRYSRIFHLDDLSQHYGGSKPAIGRGKLTTLRELVTDLPTYDRIAH